MKSNAAVTLQFEDFVGNNYIIKMCAVISKKNEIVFKKYF